MDHQQEQAMRCRICNSAETVLVEDVRFYEDFSAPVYDCAQCGSRFADSRPELYDSFHSNGAHYYSARMRAWTEQAKQFFDAGDVAGLRRQVAKFHFAMPHVIDIFERNNVASVLEAGCAWGYNSSYFILKRYDLLGVDISASAIEQAKAAFGDHFCTLDDARYQSGRTFDGIFHLGTVGCVEKPIEFTQQLIDRLNPGGVLVFNAPTRRPADQLDMPWVWGASPPDLVTLFSDSFWQEQFGSGVVVDILRLDHEASTSFRLRRKRQSGQRQPDRGRLMQPKAGALKTAGAYSAPWKTYARRVADAAMRPFVEPVANDFGAIVSMKRI